MSSSDLFTGNLVGGDRKQQAETALHKIEKKIEGIMKTIFELNWSGIPHGADPYNRANITGNITNAANWLQNELRPMFENYGFSVAATAADFDAAYLKNTTQPEVEFLFELQSLLNKAVGFYTGDGDIKEELGDEAETARDQIKQGFQSNPQVLPFGPGNRQLAIAVSSALKFIIKDYGDGESAGLGSSKAINKLIEGDAEIARAINALAAALSGNNRVAAAAGGSDAVPVSRKKYRL